MIKLEKELTSKQILNLINLDLSGQGGKENEIAEALGHERIHQPLVDARCPITGLFYEYKKQSRDQWFDLHKLSGLSSTQKSMSVLFFVHEGGKFKDLYQTTYQGVIDSINLNEEDWECARKAPVGAQVKYSLTFNQIKEFVCLT